LLEIFNIARFTMAYSLMEGNEAVAHVAIRGGCNFFASYPITPAASILAKMLQLLPPQGGLSSGRG
jgi:2-oxoglutarate ferredoxin oxidoreductase subunit alpha